MLVYASYRQRLWVDCLNAPPSTALYVLEADSSRSIDLPTTTDAETFLRRLASPPATSHSFKLLMSLFHLPAPCLSVALHATGQGLEWLHCPDLDGRMVWVCLTKAYKTAKLVTPTELRKLVDSKSTTVVVPCRV